MKRGTFRPPTEEQVRRSRQRKQESAARYQEKRKARARSGGGLVRGKGLKRSRHLSPVPTTARGKARKRERFERAFHSVEFVLFVKSLGCCVPGCERTDIQCAHVDRPRSRGGRWFEIAPLCGSEDRPGHHREQEKRTKWFNRKYGIRLELIAAATAQRFLQRVKS